MTLLPACAAIALGSNLGDSRAILDQTILMLGATPGITVASCSHWYQTKALTLPHAPPQPDYLNGCAILHTSLSPEALLQTLLAIEQTFGRVRAEPWAARTLDLDLLLFDDVILDTPTLQIPHPRMGQRAFVLVPLADIAPDWIDPISGCSISRLLEAVDYSEIKKID
jgi:2-amino-4-hydroxy-6-hydroxymethyldihydropteridine diphosphokinase